MITPENLHRAPESFDDDTLSDFPSESGEFEEVRTNPRVPVYRPGDSGAEENLKVALKEELNLAFDPTISFSDEASTPIRLLRWLRKLTLSLSS